MNRDCSVVRRPLRFAIVTMAASLYGLTSAHGEPRTETNELVAQGIQLRRQHEDAAAPDAFRRAYAIDHSPRTLAQMALAEQALGRWRDAERNLEEALRATSDPWIERNRDALLAELTDLGHHLGRLDIEANAPGAE